MLTLPAMHDPAALSNELHKYSELRGCAVTAWDSLTCPCGNETFTLFSDEIRGGAGAVCSACDEPQSLFDSADLMQDVEQHCCSCEHDHLYVMTAVACPDAIDLVRWRYIAGQCAECALVGVYVDWSVV